MLMLGEFERKVWKNPIVCKGGIQKIDVTLTFQKATGNDKFIDFYRFPSVLRALKDRLGLDGTLGDFVDQLE